MQVCLAGAGIYDLQQRAKDMSLESHSVLGSIFLNPSVSAGVALGSGGTQSRKGPVYTERILYVPVTNVALLYIYINYLFGEAMMPCH